MSQAVMNVGIACIEVRRRLRFGVFGEPRVGSSGKILVQSLNDL